MSAQFAHRRSQIGYDPAENNHIDDELFVMVMGLVIVMGLINGNGIVNKMAVITTIVSLSVSFELIIVVFSRKRHSKRDETK